MAESPFQTSESGITWIGDGETIAIEAWGPHSVRVRSTQKAGILDTDWALLPPQPSQVDITVAGDVAELRNGRLLVRLHSERWDDLAAGYIRFRCRISFHKTDGTVLLEELSPGGSLKREARDWHALGGGAHRLTAAFAPQATEKLYGMGQYQDGVFNLKGATLELAHRNSQASVPFLYSSRGYGFLWHNPAIGRATFASTRTEWVAESTQMLDYWFTAGDSPADVLSAYVDATGHVPVMPERGLGLWQSKLRYTSQEELLEVARTYHQRGLALDVIVADFFHWPHMGDFRFEEEFWPDPQAMVAELREMGTDLMVSVWPQVALTSENYETFRKNNGLVLSERGVDIHMTFEGPSAFVDVTSPAGRNLLWDALKRNYHQVGVRTFWLDEAEPEFGMYDWDNYLYAAGPASQVANLYPQNFSRAVFEGQTREGQTDIVNLVRSAWAGSQRYGALVWSGDIYTTWTDLRNQIVAGLQMGIAGIPWFTTDIGGFQNGNPDDPDFRELLIRWFQFATFCPVLRMHGDRQPSHPVVAADGSRRLPSGAPNELWSYGDGAYQILSFYSQLRENLRPYLRQVMSEANADGRPVMRPLFFAFPHDDAAWDVSDQFMLGDSVLVAPVVQSGVQERSVYLPAGSSWRNLFTGDVSNGGTTIVVASPIEVIPVFVRDESIQLELPGHP